MKLIGLKWGTLGVWLLLAQIIQAATTNLFFTRFEENEGYSSTTTLVGQKGWQGLNTGRTPDDFDNGLVTGFLDGEGQHAYMGFSPPPFQTNQVLIWQPINYMPPSNALVKFSVLMSIIDSTNNRYDDFDWTVYNLNGDPLFRLSFNNSDTNIYYDLDGPNVLTKTGKTYAPNVVYALSMLMDFTGNKWSATLDGEVLVTNKNITTIGMALNLGDIDAAWFIADPKNPGNNYLVFDNYQVSADIPELAPIAPRIDSQRRNPNGSFLVSGTGESGKKYVLESTLTFDSWLPLQTNSAVAGRFSFTDGGASGLAQRFYRIRLEP